MTIELTHKNIEYKNLDWWMYECPKCKTTYSTTESDTDSVLNFEEKYNVKWV